jgi:hypothetical protein
MFNLCTFSYIVRPAIAPDKWQIQWLLSNFGREAPWRSRKLHYLVLEIEFYTQLEATDMRSADLSIMLRHELGISIRPHVVPLVLR